MKKTSKGYYCLECKRELTPDDVRSNACKRCEKKPAEIEYCVARIVFFMSKCQHNKKMEKPFVCCGKTWATPSFTEDLARVSYECDSCGVKGDIEPEIKHKEGCKPKFGGGLKKICAKSGKAPHVGDDK